MHSFPSLRSWFALLLCSACVFGLASTALAQAPTPPPSPLSSILSNKGELGIDSVKNAARSQATGTPNYKSNGVETRTFDGYFQAAANTTKLAILSDDGSSVSVDGQQILSRAGQGQGFEDFDSCFSPLSFSFTAGQTYHITVQYTNTVHTGDADVDGVSLWAYDGGGDIVDGFNVQVTQSDATPNPAGVGEKVTINLDAKLDTPSGVTVSSGPTWGMWDYGDVEYRATDNDAWSSDTPDYDLHLIGTLGQSKATYTAVFYQAGQWRIQVKAKATFVVNNQTFTRGATAYAGK